MPAQRDPQATPWSPSCRRPGPKPSSNRGGRCQCDMAKASHHCPSTPLPPTWAATLQGELGSCLWVGERPLPPEQTGPLAAAPRSVGPDPGPERIRGPLPGQSPRVAHRHLGLPTVSAGHREHRGFWNFQSHWAENAPPPPSAWVPQGPEHLQAQDPPETLETPLLANSTKQLRKVWPLCLLGGLSWSPHKELVHFRIA